MGEEASATWNFQGYEHLHKASVCTMRSYLTTLKQNLNEDERPVIPLGHGDPSAFPSFRTAQVAEDAIVAGVRSGKGNSYGTSLGMPDARRAIAEYLSRDLPNELSVEEVYVTIGARQAIDILITALARPGANILLPKPGYPLYEGRAVFSHLEVRHFNLLPDKAWEVDLNEVEALADDKTVAIVIINPGNGNPCGNVYTYEHLQKIAETARKLGILAISDEAYGYLTYGSTTFVPSQGVGHNTDECRHFNQEVEKLIERGYLSEYVANYRAQDRQARPYADLNAQLTQNQPLAEICVLIERNNGVEGFKRQKRGLVREVQNCNHMLTAQSTDSQTNSFSFCDEDAYGLKHSHTDALVITMPVEGVKLHKTLVDNGSSVNIIYWRTFQQMKIDSKSLRPYGTRLRSFTGDYVEAKGQIRLSVELGDEPCKRIINADFIIVDVPSNNNAILGRPILYELRAATSIYHYVMKFPTCNGTAIVRGDQQTLRERNLNCAEEIALTEVSTINHGVKGLKYPPILNSTPKCQHAKYSNKARLTPSSST